jgi:oxygen-independent coproporphyrinogen-3 oxidase
MASLYIHIPFCVGKCRYCDFYSCCFDTALADAFIDSLEREWKLVCSECAANDFIFDTVYIGGGTPSVLTVKQWEKLGDWIGKTVRLGDGFEWTVECNPESFSAEKARCWHDMGVTRLTFGIQSLEDRMLKLLKRPHNVETAVKTLEDPCLGLFRSIGADIMYSLPGQQMKFLENTLKKVLSIALVSHLSAYELSIHDNTPFGRHRRFLILPGEDETAEMMDMVINIAQNHGLLQYEVSNFARPGHQSRHNTAYWNHVPYAGLGPSAHSLLPFYPEENAASKITDNPTGLSGFARYANVADVSAYISDIRFGKHPFAFKEKCTAESIISEMLFLRFRTCAGLDEEQFLKLTGRQFYSDNRASVLDRLVETEYLIYEAPWWKPTGKGLRMADAIAGKLM